MKKLVFTVLIFVTLFVLTAKVKADEMWLEPQMRTHIGECWEPTVLNLSSDTEFFLAVENPPGGWTRLLKVGELRTINVCEDSVGWVWVTNLNYSSHLLNYSFGELPTTPPPLQIRMTYLPVIY